MHVGHVALRVARLAEARAFAAEILHLRERSVSPTESCFTSNEKHHELQLIAASEASLDHLGLEVESEADLERCLDSVVAAGGTVVSELPQEEGLAHAFRVLAPGDLVFEIYCGMQRDAQTLGNALRKPLRRFGHITLLSTESPALVEFLISGLGFRVSDTLGERLTWLRCDTEHHGVAVGPGERNWLHHYAFEVNGWTAIREFLDGLAPSGIRPVWGPVRHGPGLNIASYVPDSEGCLAEVYTELVHIDADSTYVPVDWSTVPGSRNLWGPEPPVTFLENHGMPIALPRD